MPDTPTVNVTIPVEPAIAAVMGGARTRAAMGRLVSRALQPDAGPSPLARAISEAQAARLTDTEIDAELDAYNAERRSAPAA